MSDDKWGPGNLSKIKIFETNRFDNGTKLELFFGEHPHSRQDGTIYARTPDGGIYGFDGHRRRMKIDIEEFNYLKTSELSGDEVRKGCKGKLFVNDVQCYTTTGRTYEGVFHSIQNWVAKMETNWDWYPHNVKKEIGRVIGYQEQLFRIKSFDIEEGTMIIETADGLPRKRFLWEDPEDFEMESKIVVDIISPQITWYPK